MKEVGYQVHRTGAASEGRSGGRVLLRARRHLCGRIDVVEAFDTHCSGCGIVHSSRDSVMSADGAVCPTCDADATLNASIVQVDGWWVGVGLTSIAAAALVHAVLTIVALGWSGFAHPVVASNVILLTVECIAALGFAEGVKGLRLGHAQADLLPEELLDRVRRSNLLAVLLGSGCFVWGGMLWLVALLL